MNEIPTFRYRRLGLLEKCVGIALHNSSELESEFDQLLLKQWKSAMQKGLFRYTLEHVQTRVIPGDKQFVAQFNDKRTTKRRKPSPITSIRQPFNPDVFNFNKIKTGEILFKICPEEDNSTSEAAENLVIINDSPVDVGHVLLVPRSNQGLPQVLTEDALRIAIDMMLLSNHRGFRVCWNSLGALASVNHLHFHVFYLDYPLLAETISASPITSNGCFEIKGESTKGFVFQLHEQTVDSLSRLVLKVSSYLLDKQVPHNICVSRGDLLSSNSDFMLTDVSRQSTLRVFLWPKKGLFGTNPQYPDTILDPPFNNACIEPAGFLVIKDLKSYTDMTEEEANDWLGKHSLTEKEFSFLKEDLKEFLKGSN